jgi:peptide/bleomycin uptake transporter
VVAFWYSFGTWLGELLGFKFTPADAPPVIGLGYFITPEFIWFDIYYIIASLAFFGFCI